MDSRWAGLEHDRGRRVHAQRRLSNFPTQPRLGLRANVTSGDRNALDSDLETFNPLARVGERLVNLHRVIIAHALPAYLNSGFAGLLLPVTYMRVKASINFGPTIMGPDDGTLIVTANPGDLLILTWALGTDTSIGLYRGFVSGVDTTELIRFGGSLDRLHRHQRHGLS